MAKIFKPVPAQAAKMPVRNPILLDKEPDDVFKPSRMLVGSYKVSGTEDTVSPIQDKPRGMARGTFSLKNMGTLTLAQEEKVPEPTLPRRAAKPVTPPPEPAHRKASGIQPPLRNPITLEGVPEETEKKRPCTTSNWRPSSVSETLNNRRYMMPSEHNPGKHRSGMQSDIFGLSSQDSPEVKPRLTLERPSQAGNLLQYKFAPNFKNDGVSAKPETQLLTQEHYQDFKVHQNQAELYKIRCSQSTLPF